MSRRGGGVLLALAAAVALFVAAPAGAGASTSSTALLGNTSYSDISNAGSSSCAAGSYAYGAQIWTISFGGNTYTRGLAALCRDAAGNQSQAAATAYISSEGAVSACNGTDSAVGIYGRSGEILDALGVVCLDTATGATYDAALVGGSAGGPDADTVCATGSALTGFTDWFGGWDNQNVQYGAQGNCDPYYDFSGVLPPVSADGTSIFKAGSTVPVKFAVTDLTGASVSDLGATLTYAMLTDGVPGGTVVAGTNVAATVGNQFRYDSTSGQYIFNWSTKGLPAGTYQLTITLSYGTDYTVTVALA